MFNLDFAELKFPDDFLWGSSTAAHQIEGDNIHSWHWEREQAGHCEHKSGKACNSWELYKEDIELLKGLGHQGYRFSIEWSKIEPREGDFCQEAIDHYVDLLRRLREAGIKAIVTWHHFTDPKWFNDKGGWDKRENVDYFIKFIEKIAPIISEYVFAWNVINEFNGGVNPDKINRKGNSFIAHARGYHAIKAHSSAPVSTAHAFVNWQPRHSRDFFDKTLTNYTDWMCNEFFFHGIRTGEMIFPLRDVEYIPEMKGAMDYWSVNYYTRHMVDARYQNGQGPRYRHAELKMIPMDFYLEEFYPEGFIENLDRLKDLPVYIIENGTSCYDDRWRVYNLAYTLVALREAMDRGVDLRGYFHWSLLDNYEWGSFTPRFGLVGVDLETFERTPKPSAEFYGEIIDRNGLDVGLLRKYLPDLPKWELFRSGE